ncbi:MAG: SDR family oxidoreductase [Bacteroidales bacterium]
MDLLLKNRKILITGGSRGIGLACARILAAEGAELIISSRSKDNLEKAEKVIGSDSQVHAIPADVSKKEDIGALAEFVNSKFGYLDGLIMNSGGPPMGAALGHSDEVWLSAFNTLLMSVVRLTRYFVPSMQERKYGRVISISSTGVKQPIQGLVLSNSIRQSVGTYLKTLSAEVAKNNVFINSLLPGATDTERLASLHNTIAKNTGKSLDEVIAMRRNSIPAGKFAEPENLAALAAFLLSERNGYITGQSIAVDGGMVSYPL